MGLGSSESLGGVSVRIGADLAGWRAGVATVKADAQQVAREVKLSLPVIVDVSRARAEMGAASRMLQAVASASPVVIPVRLDVSGAAAQLRALSGMGGGMMGGGGFGGGAGGGGGQLMLPGPGGPLAMPGGMPTSGPYSFAGGSAFRSGYAAGEMAPQYGAKSGSGFGAGTRAMGLSADAQGVIDRGAGPGIGGMRAAIGLAALAQTVGGGMTRYAQGDVVAAQVRAGNTQGVTGEQLALAAHAMGNGASYGFGGSNNVSHYIAPYVSAMPVVGAVFNGIANQVAAGPLAAAAAGDAKSVRMAARAQELAGLRATTKGLNEGVADSNVASRMLTMTDPQERFSLQAAQTRALTERQIEALPDPVKMDRALLARMRAATETSIGAQRTVMSREVGDRYARLDTANDTTRTIALNRVAAAGGDDDAAFAMGQESTRMALVGQHAGERVGVRDPRELAGMSERQGSEVGALDAEQARARVERERDTANRIRAIRSEGAVAILEADKQGFAAQRTALEEANRQRVESARNASKEEQAAVAATNAAQVRALAIQQGRELAGFAQDTTAAIGVARLRAGGNRRAATLAGFDADTDATVRDASPEKQDGVRQRRAAERVAMEADMGRDQANLGDSLTARNLSAKAISQFGAGPLASVYGRLAGYNAEIRNADAADQPAVRATIGAELAATRADLTRRRTYATEFDFSRERTGGATDDKGGEMVLLLKSIDSYMEKLAGDKRNVLKN